jgi:hypothetical protein
MNNLTLFLDKTMCYQQQMEKLRVSWIQERCFPKNFGYKITEMVHVMKKYPDVFEIIRTSSIIINTIPAQI